MRSGAGLLSVPTSVERPSRVAMFRLSRLQTAKLADALRKTAALITLSSVDDLQAILRRTVEPVDLLVMGVANESIPTDAIVRRVRQERPQLPIVAFLAAAPSAPSSILSLTAAGVHEIVVPTYNDNGVALAAACMAARRGCASRWVLARLTSALPARLSRLAEAILFEPAAVVTVPRLAERTGVHRKTLYN